jgi:hypothetical protein
MNAYRNGNRPIKRTMHYTRKAQTDKANRIFAKVIQRFYPDCRRASLSASWAIDFNSNDLIIEIGPFKIICGQSVLHPGVYFYAIIAN